MSADIETLKGLLARVKSAKIPSREIEWGIADYFGEVPKHSIRTIGWDYEWYRKPDEFVLWRALDSEGRSVTHWTPPPVTSSTDAALALVARCLPGWKWCVGRYEVGGIYEDRAWAWVSERREPEADSVCFKGEWLATPALALLAALLSALIAEKEAEALPRMSEAELLEKLEAFAPSPSPASGRE